MYNVAKKPIAPGDHTGLRFNKGKQRPLFESSFPLERPMTFLWKQDVQNSHSKRATMKVTDLKLPELYQDTSGKSHGCDTLDRHDRKYRGTITIDEKEIPCVAHLMFLDYHKPNPNGHWHLTFHINATDIYKAPGRDGKFHQHETCYRCAVSLEDEVEDDYATPNDTTEIVLPFVVAWFKKQGIRIKHSNSLHTYLLKPGRRAGKEKQEGSSPTFVTNRWRCNCPVHGKFSYKVEESLGM